MKLNLILSAMASLVAFPMLSHAVVLQYAPGRSADFVSGTTAASGGYVTSGKLSNFNQSLYYNSSYTVSLSGNSVVSFSGNYVSYGTTANIGAQSLRYRTGGGFSSVSVAQLTSVSFSGGSSGLLTSAQLASPGQTVYYNTSGNTVQIQGSATFSGGNFTNGTAQADQGVYYGPSRLVYILGGSSVTFGGANVVSGVSYIASGRTWATVQSLKTNATTSVNKAGLSYVSFSGGYLVP